MSEIADPIIWRKFEFSEWKIFQHICNSPFKQSTETAEPFRDCLKDSSYPHFKSIPNQKKREKKTELTEYTILLPFLPSSR